MKLEEKVLDEIRKFRDELNRILESEELVGATEEKKKKEDIGFILRKLGCPVNIKGYSYIAKAIEYTLEAQEFPSMTKKLYPCIAKEFNTTPSRVERAIRHAIEVAWTRGDVELFEKVFAFSVNPEKGKPVNCEFIAAVTEYIRNS